MELPDRGMENVDQAVLNRAVRFIEYRARSKGETRDRIRRWGYDDITGDQVVAHLEGCGLLDDREFARVFMGELLRKGFGLNRVRSELLKKKLQGDLIEEVLGEYPIAEELDRAIESAGALSARFKAADPSAARRKTVDYLRRRGYSWEVAVEACRRKCDVDTEIGPE